MASSIHALATTERAADGPAHLGRPAPGLGQRLLADPSGRVGLAIVAGLCVIAIVGPALISYDPSVVDVPQRLLPPSGEHWLGTDEFGSDILGGLVSGAHITLQIGLISVAIGILVGSPFGLLAGYFRGSVDLVVSAVTDILLAFPSFLLALAIVSALGPSLQNAIYRWDFWVTWETLSLLFGQVAQKDRERRECVAADYGRRTTITENKHGCHTAADILAGLLPNISIKRLRAT